MRAKASSTINQDTEEDVNKKTGWLAVGVVAVTLLLLCSGANSDSMTAAAKSGLGKAGNDVQYASQVQRGGSHGAAAAHGPGPSGNTRPVAGSGAVQLFVAVLSAAANRVQRDAVRATWGSDPRLHRVVFVLAKPLDDAAFDKLRKEAAARGDIVVLQHVMEDYYNIQHQTLEACRAAALDRDMTHMLKTDDDSFIRVGMLLRGLAGAPTSHTYYGHMLVNTQPNRDIGSKWYVSQEQWPADVYPPYMAGPGYVLTADLVREVASGAALEPGRGALFKLEDVAMGTWIKFIGEERGVQIHYVDTVRSHPGGCYALDDISHKLTAAHLYCVWASRGECCSEEEQAWYHQRLQAVAGDARRMKYWRPDAASAVVTDKAPPPMLPPTGAAVRRLLRFQGSSGTAGVAWPVSQSSPENLEVLAGDLGFLADSTREY